MPRLWQADLYRENQLFLDKTVPDIIEEILKQAGLTTRDYELKLTKHYPRWEYICQYRETDFDFISRWMEREGIYYFFEQGEQGEKLIITDSSTAHRDIPGNTTIPFSPPSGLMPEEEAIKAFICRQRRLPNRVILKDYNYRKPSLDLKAETVVDAKGRGNVYFYGEHFKTPEEGHALAEVRAEEIRCRENVFHGEGTEPGLRPGFIFEMTGHYRVSYNRKYLTVEIEHQGGQTEAFTTGTGAELTEKERQLTYSNTFTAIPADVQFRPECKTPKPRFYGTMNAKVDAAGAGEYAELDDLGRYKVKLPFDQSDMDGGKASRWVRMSQPYAGAEHGMHFPLHKGTEVLLTFVDGDPDRPVIAGAVPNAETTSPVTAANQTESVIQTGGKNKIRFEDLLGSERIIMETPAANSWLRMGTPNDPDYVRDRLKGKGIKIYTKGELIEESEDHQAVILPSDYDSQDFELTDGAYESIQKDLEKEQEHIRKNKELVEGFLKKEDNPKVIERYNNEIGELETTIAAIDFNDIKSRLDRITKEITGAPQPPIDLRISGEGTSTPQEDKSPKERFVEKVKAETFSSDEKANNIIVSSILRNTINKNAKQRTKDISGDQINSTAGSHKMASIKGDVKIDMTDQGIYIDAGKEKDVTIKCRNFYLKNEDEDNITYGNDYYAHFGSNKEYFYGKSFEYFYGDKHEEHHGNAHEHFYGDKLETFWGSSGDWYMGHKIEGFLGPKESFSFAQSLEMYLGLKEELSFIEKFELFAGLKQELSLGHCFELFVGAKHEMNVGPSFEWCQGKFRKDDWVLGKNVAEVTNSDSRVKFAIMTILA
ncbi:MAG: type VI secretion system Vgr family protein [Desulfatiglandales bacterium]